MARRAYAASFVLGSLALVAGQTVLTQGCTQDFGTFDTSGGADPSGPASSGSQASSGAGTPTSSSSSKSSTGPGGGEGGDGGAGPTTTTASTGGGGCDGASDCDDDNPCTTDTCTDGVCGNADVPDGPLGEDDPVDCVDHECVGGEAVDVPDDTENPDDANPPCELTICQDGEVTPEFADEGTSCGDVPQECDGAGTCLGCDPDGSADQCGAATECGTPSCVDPGECDPGFEDDGTVVTDPTNGDCQRNECTGSSLVPESRDDDTDVPAALACATVACDGGAPDIDMLDEGDACLVGVGVCDGLGTAAANCHTCRDTQAGATMDAGCNAANPICVEGEAGGAGVCHHCLDSAVDDGTDLNCPSNQVCNPTGVGTCVGCYTDGSDVAINCDPTELCDPDGNGTCADTCFDLGAGEQDEGCDDVDFPACRETGTRGCEECQDAADCADRPEGHLCNQGGGTPDECGCSGNNVAGAASCAGSPSGSKCLANTACGCQGGVASTDCDDAGSAGPDCVAGACE